MIRFALREDIPAIMNFIDVHWKQGHILARDRAFFEYQYVTDDRVTFVIATAEDAADTDALTGVLGFIPYDHACRHLSLALWKALKTSGGMVGMLLLDFLIKELQPEILATPGVDPKTTTPIYRMYGLTVAQMRHFYRLTLRDAYRIAVVPADVRGILRSDPPAEAPAGHATITCRAVRDFQDYLDAGIVFDAHAIPKEDWYIEKRYFAHPVYRYRLFLVTAEKEDPLVVVIRVQEAADSACLRIVDLLGNYRLLCGFTPFSDALAKEHGYEYVDCYATGIDETCFLNAGFLPVEAPVIIPNYFAPFEQRAVGLWYSAQPKGTVLLRGDGDQDRPG